MAYPGTALPLVIFILATIGPIADAVICVGGKADVVFVIDSSGSVGSTNFKTTLKFVQNVTSALDVGEDKIRVAAIRFSSSSSLIFHLDRYTDHKSLIDAIGKISYSSGSTLTHKALESLRKDAMGESNGGRNGDGVPQIGVVITDGKSSSASSTKSEATLVKNAGIQLVSVGIGTGVNDQELQDIASNAGFVFQVKTFTKLFEAEDGVLGSACSVAKGVACLSGNCSKGTSVQCNAAVFLGALYLCEMMRRQLF